MSNIKKEFEWEMRYGVLKLNKHVDLERLLVRISALKQNRPKASFDTNWKDIFPFLVESEQDYNGKMIEPVK